MNSAFAAGTYLNKNSFAGLLELVLPLTVMYGTVVLYRGRKRGVFETLAVVKACLLFAVAAGLVSQLAPANSGSLQQIHQMP